MPVRVASLLLCALVMSTEATAHEPLQLVTASFLKVDAQLKEAKGHPNEEWRLNGLKAYLSGRYVEAIDHFERAASYADKYSQHYLSLIYWHGQGVATDRVRAYIWSDLAAERGSRKLLVIREKMWSQLTPAERERALGEGMDFYAQYGDAIAKPRAESEIRRFAHNMTGSRVGFRNQAMDIIDGGPINGSFTTSAALWGATAAAVGGSTGDKRYAAKRANASAYWAAQDEDLEHSSGTGRVEIGDLERAEESD